jgi:uncharacterized protein YndB with AHSA1/START domain
MNPAPIDPKLDLTFAREVDLAPEWIWRAWTTPALLLQWFTPAPWKTVDCEIDLQPGGMFRTVMCSPEGAEFPGMGCYLEVVENEKLTWTNALLPGYRPALPGASKASVEFVFTATISLTPNGRGTHYRAIVLHGTEDACKQHAAMGFEEGWGKALDQLIALMKKP